MSKENVKSHIGEQVHRPLANCFAKIAGEFQKLSDESGDAGQAVRFQKLANHCTAASEHHGACADELCGNDSKDGKKKAMSADLPADLRRFVESSSDEVEAALVAMPGGLGHIFGE